MSPLPANDRTSRWASQEASDHSVRRGRCSTPTQRGLRHVRTPSAALWLPAECQSRLLSKCTTPGIPIAGTTTSKRTGFCPSPARSSILLLENRRLGGFCRCQPPSVGSSGLLLGGCTLRRG